jgi:DNA polymerase elongation subunit (family B)
VAILIGRVVKVEKDGRIIKMWVRLSKKQKEMVQIYDFYPYFYVPDDRGEYMAVDNVRVRKIIANDPSDVPKIRSKHIKHYEADIPYTRRFLIDTEISDCVDLPIQKSVSWKQLKSGTGCESIPYRTWFIDIEVYADTLPDPSNPIYQICSISIYDTYIGKYITFLLSNNPLNINTEDWIVYTSSSEEDLLMAFLKTYIHAHPDIITGWNIEWFDIPYLRARMKKLGFEWGLSGTQTFDYLEGFRRLFKRQSYKLKAIAVEEGLIPQYVSFSTSMSPEELAKYNKQDVWTMVELEKRYGVLNFHLQLRSVTGVNELNDTLYNSVLVDTALLRIAKRRGIILPSKPEEVEEVEYEGAIVLEPPTGIFEGVAVFDMARYYPNIMISFNISPDTFDVNGDIKYPPNNVSFRSDVVGIIPHMVRTWLQLREELEKVGEKEKAQAVKFLANSVYGVFAHERFRLYDVRLASTVTAVGREGILYTKKLAEEKGYRVLYSDTDSIMIQIPFDKAEELVKYLNEEIERYFKERYGVRECTIGLKFEKYYGKIMFFGVKKRYAGILIWEKGQQKKELITVGLEAVRTDQSKFSKEFQQKLIEMVLNGARLTEVKNFIEEAKREMRKRPLIDIALMKGLSRGLDEYKANAPHVRAVLYSNKYLGTKFGRGNRVYILWVKGVEGLPPTDVIAFDEDAKLPKVVVDWEKMEEVNITQKAKPVLEVMKKQAGNLIRWLM